mgnify:FL=1
MQVGGGEWHRTSHPHLTRRCTWETASCLCFIPTHGDGKVCPTLLTGLTMSSRQAPQGTHCTGTGQPKKLLGHQRYNMRFQFVYQQWWSLIHQEQHVKGGVARSCNFSILHDFYEVHDGVRGHQKGQPDTQDNNNPVPQTLQGCSMTTQLE